jgi:membrane protein required for colicin V production
MVYDLVMAAIVLFTTWRGAAKGVAWQLAGIAALVLCFLFATPVSLAIAPLIKIDPPLNRWIAMLATYLIFSFVCFAAARTVRGALEAARFEEFDRHLGAAFGFIKGAALCFVITFFAVCLSGSAADSILPTYSGKISQVVMRKIQTVLPAELERTLAPHLEKFDATQIAGEEPRTGNRTGGQGGARKQAGYFPNGQASPGEPDGTFRGSRGNSGERAPANGTPGNTTPGRRRPAIEDDDFNDQTSTRPAGRVSPSGRTVEPTETDALGQIVRDVTGSVERQVRDGIKDAIQEKLNDFLTPASSSGGGRSSVSSNPALKAERKQLLRKVTGVFYSAEDDMAAAEADINATLTGLSDAIAVTALRDWSADLFGETDPDPKTDVGTALEERVLRALSRAGITSRDLPPEIRQRLGVR